MLGPSVIRAMLCGVLLLGPPAALLAQVAAPWATAPPVTRREVRVGVPGVPIALDPAAALEGAVPLIARQVFDTLVVYREGSTDIEPGLATRWSVSRDGLVWTFTLREGVRFHDGTPLTSAEVAASFERYLRPEGAFGAGVWAQLLRGAPGVVQEVRALDPRTFQIVLVQPYAPLLTVLAHPGLAVVRALSAPEGVRLVGSGPYRVVDASAGRLALEAVGGYWGKPVGAPRIVFLDVSTDDQAEAELDAGALDLWFPEGAPRRLQGALSVPGLRVGYIAFQTEKEPFSIRRIRRAVAAALDPAVLGVALDRAAVPLQSFLPPGVWARREGSPVLGGSRETVRALLREGGLPTDPSPALLVPAADRFIDMPKLGEAIQILLGSDGMTVRVQVAPEAEVRAQLGGGAFDLALVEARVLGGDPHLFLFPLSTSEAAVKGPHALNYSFYRSARLDDLLIRASQLAYRPERRKLYLRAQATLAEELPWIPIYVRLHWAATRPAVHGLRLHPTGFHRLDGVTIGGEGGER